MLFLQCMCLSRRSLFQVHDLREEAPDKVLHKLYGNLERLKSNGDDFAAEIGNRLKLIVSWVSNGTEDSTYSLLA